MILTALTAVGCSDSREKNETAENGITVSTSSEIKTTVDNKDETAESEITVSTSPEINTTVDNKDEMAENETKFSDANMEQTNQNSHKQESDTSGSEMVIDSSKIKNKNSNTYSGNSNEVSKQQNEMIAVIPDEQDIIFESPVTTASENKSSSFVTTTTASIEEEEIIVTESVIELPFVPAN
jgi:recombination DNA repair RAD52 pathway protein